MHKSSRFSNLGFFPKRFPIFRQITTPMPKKFWTLCSVLWLSLILYLSFYKPSNTASEPFFSHQDKVGHFVVYGLLFFLFAQSLRFHFQRLKFLSEALFASLFLGLLIEILQGTLTYYRVSDWKDAVANASGIISCFVVYIKNQK